jgi:hypothetical protein
MSGLLTDHLTPAQREAGGVHEGRGWGFGGSVDSATPSSWKRLGRYGWVGGTGTAAASVAAAVAASVAAQTDPKGKPAGPS